MDPMNDEPVFGRRGLPAHDRVNPPMPVPVLNMEAKAVHRSSCV
jgi:hypothetical protein